MLLQRSTPAGALSYGLFTGNRWQPVEGRARVPVLDPASGEQLAEVAAGTADDVDGAVRAAAAAFPQWAATPAAERSRHLLALHEALSARADEAARVISRDVGTPIALSGPLQVDGALQHLRQFAELAAELPAESSAAGGAVVRRVPVGVVACITPWNYPLHQVLVKLGAALAAGCTVVVKPSEIAPLAVVLLGEAIADAGLPHDVVTIAHGRGEGAGDALVRHPQVDMVSFTGSTRVGRQVAALAGERLLPVSLELGGKSANVLLDDADLATAVPDGLLRCFVNSGQTCSALTRMLVPRERQGEVEAIARAALPTLVVGDPAAPGTLLGPLASAAQRDRVVALVDRALRDGARVVAGDPAPLDGPGHFVSPLVLTDVRPDSEIAREEVFGPVLVLLPYDDEDDAVALANATEYGLFGSVWSADAERAGRVARRLRTGAVLVNGGAFDPSAPFGGMRASGLGREHGRFGIDEFVELQALHV